jgi:hypothetical protein
MRRHDSDSPPISPSQPAPQRRSRAACVKTSLLASADPNWSAFFGFTTNRMNTPHPLAHPELSCGFKRVCSHLYTSCDCQRAALPINHPSIMQSSSSDLAFASLPRKVGSAKASILCKLLKLWSGRWDSNPRRPAWEVIRHSNLNHLESAGVGLESTETPGKTAVNRKRPLNGVQLECSDAKRQPTQSTL